MGETADYILSQLSKAYQSVDSYSDTGLMETIWQPGEEDESTTQLSFSTHFKRPNLFRFEWCRFSRHSDLPNQVSVIWCDGKQAYSKYSFDDKPRKEKLNLVVAGATGVSSGTAHQILSLLIDEVGGRKISGWSDVVIAGTEEIDGEDCYRLQRKVRDTNVWVSKLRSVILRIEEDYIVDPVNTSDELKRNRFKSFRWFQRWFRNGFSHGISNRGVNYTGGKTHIIDKLTYSNVTINSAIPNEVFSQTGSNGAA